MFTRPLTGFTLTLLLAFDAVAQAPAPQPALEPARQPAPGGAAQAAPPPAQASWSAGATGQADVGAPPAVDASLDTGASSAEASSDRSGFESGLRLGIGVPLGKAGQNAGVEREVSDLTPWRAPLWLDVGYRLSQTTTLGAYAQIGLGSSGDDCAGVCNWSDIRVGAQGQWRLAPGASVNPWLGVGVGYEWLTFRTLEIVDVPDPRDPTLQLEDELRTAERLGGPELLLQGGVDFQVEDSLSIGPYASATVGQYLSDDFKCRPASPDCPTGSSIEGSGFHSWLGVGLRGTYAP